MTETPPPPSVPAGWLDDPERSGTLRYWNGSDWTDDRAPKPPPPAASGGEPKPVPTLVVINGWVDVKLSTVPSVAILTTENNWYKAQSSVSDGTLTVTAPSGAAAASFTAGTYTPVFTIGFRQERKTPTWAIIVGVIGLFFFLIGLLFFLIKETRQIETRILTVTLDNGTTFSGPYMDEASWK